MARLLRRARRRPIDEERDDELRRDASVARRRQRHRENQGLRAELADGRTLAMPLERTEPELVPASR